MRPHLSNQGCGRMNGSTAVGPWSDRKRHTGFDGFVLLRCPHDRERHPEVPTTEGPMANGAEAAFTRQERPAALGACRERDGCGRLPWVLSGWGFRLLRERLPRP